MAKKRRPLRRIVRAQGSPHECGRTIGEACRATIAECYEVHCAEYAGYREAWDRLCAGFKERIVAFTPRSAAELQGMAEGAEVDLDVIIKMQCLEELDMYISAYPWLCAICKGHIPPYGGIHCVECSFALCDADSAAAASHTHPMRRVQPPPPGKSKSRRAALGVRQAETVGHCSAFAATAAATTSDLPEGICGQTFDWAPHLFAYARSDVVWHLAEDDCPEALIYANPGVPNAGINSCGLCLMTNTMYSTEAVFSEGLPSCVIVRELLRCRALEECQALLGRGVMAVPFNYLLLQGNRIANMEGTGRRIAQSSPTDASLFFHTNHFLNRSLSTREMFPQCNTMERYSSLRASLLGHPALSQAVAVKALSVPPVLSPITLGTIVCIPHAGLLMVRFGLRDSVGLMCTNPKKLVWRKYQLAMGEASTLPPSPPLLPGCDERLPSLVDSEVSAEESSSPPLAQPSSPELQRLQGGRSLLSEPAEMQQCCSMQDIGSFSEAMVDKDDDTLTKELDHCSPNIHGCQAGNGEQQQRQQQQEEEAYGCCNRGDDGSFCICCDECNRWQHGSCAGVETAFQEAHFNSKGRRWYCEACLRARHLLTCTALSIPRKQ
eukprot:GGOE01019639.1.p1 GENE.GGOE01019639.1~~GGOE01019639.1.p1  ORF type:complete len:624 (+),score=152.20 GGOE01019639.1:50-1873(+)